MDFNISKEQTMLLTELDRFLKKEIEPLINAYEAQNSPEDTSLLKPILQNIVGKGLGLLVMQQLSVFIRERI